MGILITQEPAGCTHLASPHIIRTQKFICALAHAPVVLSTDFVDQCVAENKHLPPENFELKDVEGEKRLGFKLSESTARAKENKGHLLQSCTIYCTESVKGGFETYKAIIEANGGQCLLYRARASSKTSARAGVPHKNNKDEDSSSPEYLYLVSGVTYEESRLWVKFQQMAETKGMIPRIVKTDWIIDLALSQQIRWHDIYELSDQDVKIDGENSGGTV